MPNKIQKLGTGLVDMENADSWQNWLFTLSYITFITFIVWKVITSSSKN
jgi:hypothetical protein